MYHEPFKLDRLRQISVSHSNEGNLKISPRGGGGGNPLVWLKRYVQFQRVWFSAVLVINKVSILADFGQFGHK